MLKVDAEVGQIQKGRQIIIESKKYGIPVRTEGVAGRVFVDKRTGRKLRETRLRGASGEFDRIEVRDLDEIVKLNLGYPRVLKKARTPERSPS
jgi:hypothetical protein